MGTTTRDFSAYFSETSKVRFLSSNLREEGILMPLDENRLNSKGLKRRPGKDVHSVEV